MNDESTEDHRSRLRTVRAYAWESAHEADAGQRAALLKLVADLDAKLAALPVDKGSEIDELLARRATRPPKRPAG